MKKLIIATLAWLTLAACAATPPDGPRRTAIRDCPVGTYLVCVSSREQLPSSAGDEEIPSYDRCRCEQIR